MFLLHRTEYLQCVDKEGCLEQLRSVQERRSTESDRNVLADAKSSTRKLRRVYVRAPRILAAILTALIVIIAAFASSSMGHSGYRLSLTALAFGVLTLPYFLFAMSSIRRDLTFKLENRPVALVAVCICGPIAIYLLYAIGVGCFTWSALARLFAFVGFPTFFAIWAQSGQNKYMLRAQDFLTVFCIWVPFDAGLLSAIWAWPEGEAAYIINTSLAVSLGVTLFGSWRRLPELNFRWSWNRSDIRWSVLGFTGFVCIALPFGFATEFIKFNPTNDLVKILAAPFGIFFFIAVPEELLFRGLIQNLLLRLLGRNLQALIISSLFFGATHLNNDPVGDWRFFVLASVAGLFYGMVHTKTKTLLAPALTHTAVDVIWLLLLHA